MRYNRPHKSLRVWQRSMDLVGEIFRMTAGFPKDQRYVLGAQVQRAAVSIPSNVAEGMAKSGKKDRARFLEISQGSLSEVDTQVELAHHLGYIDSDDYAVLMDCIEEIQMMLSGLIRSQR